MRSSRPSFRVKTPPPTSMAVAGVRADAGPTPSTPSTAFLSVAPSPAAGHQQTSATTQTTSSKTFSSHPSLFALARLLGRQAALEWLAGGGERGDEE